MPQVDTATFLPFIFWASLVYIASFLLLNTSSLYILLSALKLTAKRASLKFASALSSRCSLSTYLLLLQERALSCLLAGATPLAALAEAPHTLKETKCRNFIQLQTQIFGLYVRTPYSQLPLTRALVQNKKNASLQLLSRCHFSTGRAPVKVNQLGATAEVLLAFVLLIVFASLAQGYITHRKNNQNIREQWEQLRVESLAHTEKDAPLLSTDNRLGGHEMVSLKGSALPSPSNTAPVVDMGEVSASKTTMSVVRCRLDLNWWELPKIKCVHNRVVVDATLVSPVQYPQTQAPSSLREYQPTRISVDPRVYAPTKEFSLDFPMDPQHCEDVKLLHALEQAAKRRQFASKNHTDWHPHWVLGDFAGDGVFMLEYNIAGAKGVAEQAQVNGRYAVSAKNAAGKALCDTVEHDHMQTFNALVAQRQNYLNAPTRNPAETAFEVSVLYSRAQRLAAANGDPAALERVALMRRIARGADKHAYVSWLPYSRTYGADHHILTTSTEKAYVARGAVLGNPGDVDVRDAAITALAQQAHPRVDWWRNNSASLYTGTRATQIREHSEAADYNATRARIYAEAHLEDLPAKKTALRAREVSDRAYTAFKAHVEFLEAKAAHPEDLPALETARRMQEVSDHSYGGFKPYAEFLEAKATDLAYRRAKYPRSQALVHEAAECPQDVAVKARASFNEHTAARAQATKGFNLSGGSHTVDIQYPKTGAGRIPSDHSILSPCQRTADGRYVTQAGFDLGGALFELLPYLGQYLLLAALLISAGCFAVLLITLGVCLLRCLLGPKYYQLWWKNHMVPAVLRCVVVAAFAVKNSFYGMAFSCVGRISYQILWVGAVITLEDFDPEHLIQTGTRVFFPVHLIAAFRKNVSMKRLLKVRIAYSLQRLSAWLRPESMLIFTHIVACRRCTCAEEAKNFLDYLDCWYSY